MNLLAFILWATIGILFIAMGIYDMKSKKAKPFGFWANAEMGNVEDVKGYNRTLGILWCAFGTVFVLLGLPLLAEQNSGVIMLSVLGTMFLCIAAMVVYVVWIEPKYCKKK